VSESPLHVGVVTVYEAINGEIALRDICELIEDLSGLVSLNRSHVDPSHAIEGL
jgi:hypothetical protein